MFGKGNAIAMERYVPISLLKFYSNEPARERTQKNGENREQKFKRYLIHYYGIIGVNLII